MLNEISMTYITHFVSGDVSVINYLIVSPTFVMIFVAVRYIVCSSATWLSVRHTLIVRQN